MARGRQAVHILARFHGSVVEDHVVPAKGHRLRIGHEVMNGLPIHPGCSDYGSLRWQGPSRCLYVNELGEERPLDGEAFRVREGAVELELRLVPQFMHSRSIFTGDFMMVATVGAMMLVAWLFVQLLDAANAGGDGAFHPEPTPELIARLLEEDYDGAREGFLYEEQARPDSEFTVDSYYLPEGDKGPTDTLGGSEDVADEKSFETEGEDDKKTFQPLDETPPELASVEDESPRPPIPDVQDEKELEESEASSESAETREGWGLKDHNGAAQKDDFRIRYEIRTARALLEIDPDDPWALQHMAYYQYLAEDLDDAQGTYERYIEKYPESAAGYNNLALVHKRKGEYGVEEGYYRLALAYEPGDTHAMNNLAVNLAHQSRYPEALALMDELERLTPNDPYSDLHRAKIHSAMGSKDKALFFLEKAIEGVALLDTLHTIEFRQDIRVDPAFDPLREEPRFQEILVHYYGDHGLKMAEGSSG